MYSQGIYHAPKIEGEVLYGAHQSYGIFRCRGSAEGHIRPTSIPIRHSRLAFNKGIVLYVRQEIIPEAQVHGVLQHLLSHQWRKDQGSQGGIDEDQ